VAPKLAQHIDEILTSLGYSAADIADLRQTKVI
jgi:crotonobetainyl-CoA:carnitine CoA-transferase CaiB-like acyl-CoA transferase